MIHIGRPKKCIILSYLDHAEQPGNHEPCLLLRMIFGQDTRLGFGGYTLTYQHVHYSLSIAHLSESRTISTPSFILSEQLV